MSIRADNLAALLGAYNVSMLGEMVGFLRLSDVAALNKRGLIETLARFLGTPKHLAAIRGRLSVRQWQTLSYHRLREETVSLNALLVRFTAAGASEREALADLLELLHAGCLVVVDQLEYNYKLNPTLDSMAKGEYLDLRVASFPVLLDAAEKRTAGVDTFAWVASPPKVVRISSYLEFQRECYLALRAASDGELKLTNRGLPFKTSIARLAASAAGISVGKGGKARLSEVPVSPRLWLVLAALRAARLFGDDGDLEDQALLSAVPGATGYLSLRVAEQARALFDAWLASVYNELARVPTLDFERRLDPSAPWADPSPNAYYGTDLPTLSRLRDARRSIVRAIQAGARGRSDTWLQISALQTAVRLDDPELLVPLRSGSPTYGGPYGRRARYYEGIRRPKRAFPDNLIRRDLDWAEVEGAYITTVVAEPLHWLGLVELGEGSGGELASFRLTPLGRHVLLDEPFEEDTSHGGPHVVVQPSFEVIVLDAAGNLGLVAQFDDFAERASLDRAATYRLTREAAVRGFDRGHSVQWMIGLLESASAMPLPQNVRFSLEEWSRLYERIHVRRRATLLVADSPSQLDAWLADPEMAGLLGKRLSPTAALVRGERRLEVERYVAKRDVGWRAHDYAMPFRRRFRIPEPTLIEPIADADEPYLRYRLGRFSMAEGKRFRITAESIREAIAKGLPPEAVITYLQTVADGKVPDDTCLRIRGWGGLYQPLHFGQAVVVELPPGMTPTDVQRIPEVRRALLSASGGLGGNVIALDPAGFEAVRAALAERGLTVEAGLTAPRASARSEAAKSKRSGTSTLTLEVLPEEVLRRYVEDAIVAGRPLVFGLTDDVGRREAILLLPLRIFGRDGVAYVSCRVDNSDGVPETHDIPLELIDAVGDAAELGLA